ncbi:fimbrial protein [Pseudomonas sp. BN411]|uniref:fimbrial protein n=1 Tax=Pseudomonas sp. BN411 TaxID=2567887 RepID=UPI002458474E|nr:fimbrial protein [Pseudomonas sp. BN411]MDH4560583.1 type 1 fimbrial protein [Pseudomonas sp. BN411]
MLCKRLSLAALLVAASEAALASPSTGTIQFKGVLKGTTCTVSVNGSGATDLSISLWSIPSLLLAQPGESGQAASFYIHLEKCWGAATKARVTLKGANGNTVTNGRLDNMATVNPAKNVQLEVRYVKDFGGWDSPFVDVGGDQSMIPYRDITMDGWNPDSGRRFEIRYYANGPVTEGKVQAALEYTVEYQ